MEKSERETLFARLEDLILRTERGEPAVSPFLSPRELHAAEVYLTGRGAEYRAFGGYEEAERKRVYLLPAYMNGGEDWQEELATFGYAVDIDLLRIRGSGYRVLTHRDFLGSLLALGLERDVLGDLAVAEGGMEASLFCDSRISVFLQSEWSRAANDKVTVKREPLDSFCFAGRKTEPIRDTVASARLDCVIAALCGLSREKAQQLIRNGSVEVDFEEEARPDRTVAEAALLSVRGFGRYRIGAFNGQTKKGRLRLEAEKYL